MKEAVLIIDDDPDLLALMASAFSSAGFDIHIAADGYAGSKLFGQHHPPLVVTDIVMPQQEGIETIRELKRELEPPKVIAISGGGRNGTADFLRWAKELGADETLLKPFPMAALVSMGRRLLGSDPGSSRRSPA